MTDYNDTPAPSRIRVRVPRALLSKIDQRCEEASISRDEFINDALRRMTGDASDDSLALILGGVNGLSASQLALLSETQKVKEILVRFCLTWHETAIRAESGMSHYEARVHALDRVAEMLSKLGLDAALPEAPRLAIVPDKRRAHE